MTYALRTNLKRTGGTTPVHEHLESIEQQLAEEMPNLRAIDEKVTILSEELNIAKKQQHDLRLKVKNLENLKEFLKINSDRKI